MCKTFFLSWHYQLPKTKRVKRVEAEGIEPSSEKPNKRLLQAKLIYLISPKSNQSTGRLRVRFNILGEYPVPEIIAASRLVYAWLVRSGDVTSRQ